MNEPFSYYEHILCVLLCYVCVCVCVCGCASASPSVYILWTNRFGKFGFSFCMYYKNMYTSQCVALALSSSLLSSSPLFVLSALPPPYIYPSTNTLHFHTFHFVYFYLNMLLFYCCCVYLYIMPLLFSRFIALRSFHGAKLKCYFVLRYIYYLYVYSIYVVYMSFMLFFCKN